MKKHLRNLYYAIFCYDLLQKNVYLWECNLKLEERNVDLRIKIERLSKLVKYLDDSLIAQNKKAPPNTL